ncbi:thermonuclease family protein [Pseudooceanicola nitratireducens]|uniref:thermonuclease family protein n=1 Tax=Pseudooceanicola nitratireducens TaxID=517719 RepID=UPI003C6E3DC5
MLGMKTLMTCLSLTVVDGDTLKCDGESLRLIGSGAPNVEGYDAPETWKPRCQRELQLGLLAKDRLGEIVQQPGARIETTAARDRYGRILASVRLRDGRTAGEVLIEEGLASVWRPGYRASWCD